MKIFDNGNFERHVTVSPVATQPGHFLVAFSSRWRGARNPDELVQTANLILDERGARLLAISLYQAIADA
jgi:hypothetical protein